MKNTRFIAGSFLQRSSHSFRGVSIWRPAVDIYRYDKGWLVKIELAGVQVKDIKLKVEGRCLSIQGSRRDLSVHETHQAHSMEISYNRFERLIELPLDIESATMSTEYRDGMLLVYLK